MKWLVACLLAVTAVAVADPPPRPAPVRRKPASDKYSTKALQLFVEGVMADKAGELANAAGKYRDSLGESPQANTAYNLANVHHRLERFSQAVESYKKYLELAPDAPDRKDVEAWIEQIEQRPAIAVIDGEDLDAIVLVDGKLVGPSPALIYPAAGSHVAERIGPRSYVSRRFSPQPHRTEHVRMRYTEASGNVVFSAGPALRYPSGTWKDGGHTFTLPGRFTLPPGRYETFLVTEHSACTKVAFDVAKGDHITHVYIDRKPGERDSGCLPIVVKTQKLRVSP